MQSDKMHLRPSRWLPGQSKQASLVEELSEAAWPVPEGGACRAHWLGCPGGLGACPV